MTTDTKAVERWDIGFKGLSDKAEMLEHYKGRYVSFADHERVVADFVKVVDAHRGVISDFIEDIDSLRTALAASRAEVEGLKATLQKAWEDVNWMTNEGTLLNRECFEYLDAAMEKGNG